MSAGKRDRKVSFWRTPTVDDGYSQVPGTPVRLGDAWAEKRDLSDAERIRSGAVAAEITARFRVCWSQLASGLKASDTLRCEGRVYEIVGIKEQGTREFLEISARARANE